MQNAIFTVPVPQNEPVLNYAPGSPEKAAVKKALAELLSQEMDVPMYIGGAEVRTGNKRPLSSPHNHQRVLGYCHRGDKTHVQAAVDAALAAKPMWENMSFEHRASIFLKAAELMSTKYRGLVNAATMLAQSKNIYQAEIDAVCETVDFLRFNVHYAQQIYRDQPFSPKGVWNRVEYRPLEGFVFALTPFNFTAISVNLPTSPALMGNTVVWKPADSQIYSANIMMRILREAGLPDGVINLVYVSGPDAGDVMFKHADFAGIHFTGSTGVFQNIWKTIGENLPLYKSYPRIVGETGGKDYVLAHPSANAKEVAVALSRGAFEYQGQKCSAASRAYIPASMYDEVMEYVKADLASFKMGDVSDFRNFINAVIDEKAFNSISRYIDAAKNAPDAKIIAGGGYDKSVGYFIEPTVIEAQNPQFLTMCEEIFGPVLTVYKYNDADFDATVKLVGETSPYALTGALLCNDRYALEKAMVGLRHTAGNFYINDKPTGAVVGQQPFGGGRASGTNDKAGSYLNLMRWVSARTIKENFVPPVDYTYPFMAEE